MSEKRHQRFRRNVRQFIAYSALILCGVAHAADQAPDVEIRKAADEMLSIIAMAPDKSARIKLTESRVISYFDFPRMTQLAAGRVWQQANPEQKSRMTQEFQRLLVRTYAAALSPENAMGARIEVKPPRGDSGEEVTVRTRVSPAGQKPFNMDYRMIESAQQWKVIDVLVENVSLVSNYRDWFASQAQNGGIEAVIQALAEKNRQATS